MKRLISGELTVLFIIMGLATLAMAVLNPIMPLYLTSIGISPSLIGLMLAVAMAGMVIGESSGGWLADKIGLKFPMSAGTFLCAPLVICFVFVRSIPAFFLVFLFWGIIRASIFGPARGYIGNTATLSNKATVMAVFITCTTISRSLGSLASGYMADSRWGYHGDFYLSVGLSVLASIVVFTGLRSLPLWRPVSDSRTRSLMSFPSPTDGPVNYRPVVFQSIIAALYFMAIGVNSFLPLLATEYAGVAATQVGILYTVGGVVGVILLIPMGRTADRKNKKALMMLGIFLSALNMAGLAFAREYWMLLVLQVIGNIGFAMFTPAAVALLSNNLPAYWQSTAMGIYGAAEDIGIIIGSGVGGFVWSAGGPTALYLMGSAAAMVGALICLGFVKDRTAGKA